MTETKARFARRAGALLLLLLAATGLVLLGATL